MPLISRVPEPQLKREQALVAAGEHRPWAGVADSRRGHKGQAPREGKAEPHTGDLG